MPFTRVKYQFASLAVFSNLLKRVRECQTSHWIQFCGSVAHGFSWPNESSPSCSAGQYWSKLRIFKELLLCPQWLVRLPGRVQVVKSRPAIQRRRWDIWICSICRCTYLYSRSIQVTTSKIISFKIQKGIPFVNPFRMSCNLGGLIQCACHIDAFIHLSTTQEGTQCGAPGILEPQMAPEKRLQHFIQELIHRSHREVVRGNHRIPRCWKQIEIDGSKRWKQKGRKGERAVWLIICCYSLRYQ